MLLSMAATLAKRAALSWSELAPLAASYVPPDQATGPTHSQALVRTFGQPEASVRVTLFRDNHAWCPYCQKVWLWLEEKRVPYRIAKVTMFCYGQKEDWYKRIVPSGMLPAAEIDGRIVTESDVILEKLEAAFGPLGEPLAVIMPQRRLERQLLLEHTRPSGSHLELLKRGREHRAALHLGLPGLGLLSRARHRRAHRISRTRFTGLPP